MAGWFATSAALAGLGAFGAHGLRERIAPDLLAVYDTAIRYHLIHALALLAVSWAAERWSNAWVAAAGWLFMAGIVTFSGSLYVLAVTAPVWLGAIAPIGGLCFLAS